MKRCGVGCAALQRAEDDGGMGRAYTSACHSERSIVRCGVEESVSLLEGAGNSEIGGYVGDWAQDAVVYQIPGRFFGKNGGKRAVVLGEKLCYNDCN